MADETMSMSVRQARNEVIDIGGFFDTETLTYVDNLIEAVRNEADERWEKRMVDLATYWRKKYSPPYGCGEEEICGKALELQQQLTAAIAKSKEKK